MLWCISLSSTGIWIGAEQKICCVGAYKSLREASELSSECCKRGLGARGVTLPRTSFTRDLVNVQIDSLAWAMKFCVANKVLDHSLSCVVQLLEEEMQSPMGHPHLGSGRRDGGGVDGQYCERTLQ